MTGKRKSERMYKFKAIIGFFILFIIIFSNCGCFEQNEFDVTINVLYSQPQYINNTSVYLDEKPFLQFENITIETYPPFVGDETIRLKRGKHELMVVDTNFNLTKTKSIDVKGRVYVDVIISDDEIDILQSSEQTGYK